MLNDKKKGRKKSSGNGKQNGHLEALLAQQSEALTQQGELLKVLIQKSNDQQAQIEEMKEKEDFIGKGKFLASEMAFKPDRRYLSDMAVIYPSQIEPFSLSRVCGAILDPQVRSGELSLGDIYIDEIKHLSRGLKGKGFDLAAEHAKEEVSRETTPAEYEKADLGKGF